MQDMLVSISLINFSYIKLYTYIYIFGSFSQFISNCNPICSQIISSSKYFQIIALRNQFFNYFIDFFWFLTLTPSLTENNISWNISLWNPACVSFHSNQTTLFAMLKIKSMSFCYFSINSLFYPNYFIY